MNLKRKQLDVKGVTFRPLTDAAFKKGVRSETVTIFKFCPMKALHYLQPTYPPVCATTNALMSFRYFYGGKTVVKNRAQIIVFF